MGLSRSVIPNPFHSKLASRGCLLETGLVVPAEMPTLRSRSSARPLEQFLQLDHLRGMPRLVPTHERDPLVKIDRA